ncbi:MAG: type IV pilus biogenesis/stability protein PilW [Lonepinella koalarum]|nr:type IV pilus biogenesis/stability protein PilW [Lonepinella koalarum]
MKKYLKFLPHFYLVFGLVACASSDNHDIQRHQAAKARVDLALGYLAENNYSQAKLNLDKALEHAPQYYLVHSAFAYYYQKQGHIPQAEDSYQTAIKLDPKQGDTYNNYGALLCTEKRFTEAYTQFDLALKTTNYYRQADTYENKVLCALSENNQSIFQESLAQLQKLDKLRAEKLSLYKSE